MGIYVLKYEEIMNAEIIFKWDRESVERCIWESR